MSKKNIQNTFQKLINKKKWRKLTAAIALVVFGTTYLSVAPDAITMESPSTVESSSEIQIPLIQDQKIICKAWNQDCEQINVEDVITDVIEEVDKPVEPVVEEVEEPVAEEAVEEPVVEEEVEESVAEEAVEEPVVEEVEEPVVEEVEEPVINRLSTRMAVAPRAAATPTGVDFGEFIPKDDPKTTANESGLKLYVYEAGKWVETTTFEHGDKVKVSIDYAVKVPSGENYDQIFYQIPEGIICPEKEESGSVDKDGHEVGTYVIDTTGLITIQFTDGEYKIDTTENYNGKLEFQGIVNVDEDKQDQVVTFDNQEFSFDFNDPEPDDTQEPDITTNKECTGKNNSNYKYQITVHSDKGTNGESVTIEDQFLINNGGVDAAYVAESFKVQKILSNGTSITVNGSDYQIVIDNSKNPSEFKIEGLPFLNKGESYQVQYEAEPNGNASTGTDGGKVIRNRATATSGKLEEHDTVTEVVKEPIIHKEGQYNSETKVATWEVTIKPGDLDITGYEVDDTITIITGQGTEITITNAKLTYKEGNKTITKDIELPFTFKNIPTADEYTITYTTDLSKLPAGEDIDVSNNVSLTKDKTEYKDTYEIPGIHNTIYTFDKTFESMGEESNQYSWQTTIDVPNDTEIKEQLVYKDYIKTTLVDHNGEDIENAHYTTVQALQDMTLREKGIKGGKEILTPIDKENYKIEYVELGGNTRISLDENSDTTTKVETFIVTFLKTYVNSIKGKQIVLDYHTYIDTEGLNPSHQYIIQNSAVIDKNEVVAETTYGEDTSSNLEKESKSPIDGTYSKEAVTYDYDVLYDEDLECACISYRAKFNAGKYSKEQLGDLKLVDRLPEGTTLLTEGVKFEGSQEEIGFFFAKYDNTGRKTFKYTDDTGIEKQYNAKSYFNYISSDDNGQIITFNLTDRFIEDYDALEEIAKDSSFHTAQPLCFYIEYKVKLPDKTAWDDVALKEFTNILSAGEEQVENKVTVTSHDKYISKIGVQETTGTGDSAKTTNNVDYSIKVNEDGKNMDTGEGKDQIVLTDTLKLIGADGAVATLDPISFKVYEYNKESDTKGSALTTSEYSYITELKTEEGVTSYIFYLTVPDEKALIVEYTYEIDTRQDTTVDGFKVENSVALKGSNTYEDEVDVNLIKSESQSSVEQQTLTIKKYEARNEGILLEGATFEFKKWKDIDGDGEYNWENTVFGEDSTQTTDENGMIKLNLYGNNKEQYEKDVLYRYVETVAPTGYQLDTTERYFVFVDKDNPNVSDLNVYFDSLTKPSGVTRENTEVITTSTQILKVANEKIKEYALPSTGGANTIPYMTAAMLFMVATIIYIILTKKEGKEYEK